MRPDVQKLIGSWVILAAILFSVPVIGKDDELAETVRFELSFESPLLARLGDVSLTQLEMDASLQLIAEEHRAAFLINRGRVAERFDQLLVNRLLVADAHQQGLLDDPLVKARLYHAIVEVQAGMARDELRREARDGVDFEALARERFLADPQAVRGETTYDFTHVLIQKRNRTEAEAARMVLNIYDKMDAGHDFDELVSTYSEDPSQPQNGYSDVSASDLDEQFASVLTSMAPGTGVAGPFQSAHGWHLLRLDAINPGTVLDWEAARERLIENTRERHVNRHLQRHQQRLLDGKTADIPDSALQELFQRYGVADYYGVED